MASKLWVKNEDTGETELLLDQYEYHELNYLERETRFLVVEPCAGDKNALENHVRCHFEFEYLARGNPPPYIAVRNSRGYRAFLDVIEVDGKVLLVSSALERFLRHFRKAYEPIRIWVRHICLQEFSKDEQIHYWNRPFVDSMYESATKVVDMADVVSELREKNIIDRVIDAKYQKWTKLWEEMPKEIVLPSICPVRLGKKLSNENPGDAFDYVPLDMVADEIRVLVVVESKDLMAPVVTHLAHCPIYCEVVFHALSYTWGTDSATDEIVVNGSKMVVRKNLADALRAIRQPDSKISVWIDAICIDQNNIVERNRQLTRISEIYDRAAIVISYIGEADEHSDMALNLVPYMQAPMMSFDENGEWIVEKLNESRINPNDIPRRCGALYKFLTRPYFRRAWILQEVASASNAVAACGKRFDITFQQLDFAAYNLQDMLRRDSSFAQQMVDATPGLTQVSSEELRYVRTVFYFRHLSMGGSRLPLLMRWAEIRPTAPGFLETAILSRHFEATVSLDKIYALWNLARDKGDFQFTMDYNQTMQQTFSDFTAAWAKHSGSLDIIGTAEMHMDNDLFYSSAPSWATDWSKAAVTSCLVRKEHIPKLMIQVQDDLDGQLYSADGGMKQEPTSSKYFVFESQVLECAGVIFDEIDYILDDEECDHGFWCACKSLGYVEPLETFWGTSQKTPYEDASQAMWALVHGDSIAAWPHRQDNMENADEDHPDERFVCRTELSRHIRYYGGSYSRIDALETMRNVTRGRTSAITKNRYLALIPRLQNRKGVLLIAIVATCSVPLLLQERNDGTYKLLGTCLVQGWSDGEMVTGYLGADSAEEFWDAISEDARLKIV